MPTPTSPPANATSTQLLKTVRELVLESGYGPLTIDAVARRSGIAKTTIYRRWPSKSEMVFALLVADLEVGSWRRQRTPGPTLRADMTALVDRALGLLTDPLMRAAFPGMLLDVRNDDALRARFAHAFLAPARADIEHILGAAQKRGELASAAGAAAVHATILGLTTAWLQIFPDELPPDLAGQMVRQCEAVLDVAGKP